MELYYQPIVAADTLKVSHVEALIRWNHPRCGLIFPGAFMPLAEANQKIIDRLTDWVLSAAARMSERFVNYACRFQLR